MEDYEPDDDRGDALWLARALFKKPAPIPIRRSILDFTVNEPERARLDGQDPEDPRMTALMDGWNDAFFGRPFNRDYSLADKPISASYENGRILAAGARMTGFDMKEWETAGKPAWWPAAVEQGRHAMVPMVLLKPPTDGSNVASESA